MTITGSLRLDLTALKADEHGWVKSDRVRHVAHEAALAPSGARVVLIVGRLHPHPEAIRILHEHVHRLIIDVQGADATTVQTWRDSIAAGEPVDAGVWS